MKYALCNETYGKDTPFEDVCRRVKSHGYEGLEVAPFTLADDIGDLSQADRKAIRQKAEDAGLEILGLHWCLVSPKGLHINTREPGVVDKTKGFYRELIRFCAELGGSVMVHGSPAQRNWEPGEPYYDAFNRTVDFFASCMQTAAECGVRLLIEPLGHTETNLINRAQDGLELIRAVGHPNFGLHLDVKAMCLAEYEPPAAIVRKFKDVLGHLHVNDPNLRGPGQGDIDHAPIAAALKEIGYRDWVSVEVFDYTPDPDTIARESIEYLRRVYG